MTRKFKIFIFLSLLAISSVRAYSQDSLKGQLDQNFFLIVNNYLKFVNIGSIYDYFYPYNIGPPENVHVIRIYTDSISTHMSLMNLYRYYDVADYQFIIFYYNGNYFFLINNEDIPVTIPFYCTIPASEYTNLVGFIFGDPNQTSNLWFTPSIFHYKLLSDSILLNIHFPASKLERKYWPYDVKESLTYRTNDCINKSRLRYKKYTTAKTRQIYRTMKKLIRLTRIPENEWIEIGFNNDALIY